MSDATKELADFFLTHPAASVLLAGSIATLVASAAGGGWGVAHYLDKRAVADYKRKIEQNEAQHKKDLADIERQAKAGSLLDADFPSIGDLKPSSLPIGLPAGRQYSEFNIVLTQALPAGSWTFQRSTLKDIFSDWFGSSLTTEKHLSDGYELIGGDDEERPCLLWKGRKEVLVENSTVMKKMYPFVIVRSIPHEPGVDRTTEELFNFIHWLRMWDEAMPNSRFKIVRMHRSADTAYLRGYYKFIKLDIAESAMKPARTVDEYYLLRQIFVYRSDRHSTIISTGLPNRELVSDPYYAWLRAWWDALALVKG
jgi:hypothetical protein